MNPDVFGELNVIALPMRTKFRGIELREIALFRGRYGWAEFSPFVEYGHKESARWLESTYETLTETPMNSLRNKVPINATLPEIDSEDQIRNILSLYPGATTVKVKVGNDLQRDIGRLQSVKKVNPEYKLRIDVNGHWSVDQAILAISKITDVVGDLEYAEQPCATLEELRELKKKVNVQIAGDEVIRKAADPLLLDIEGALDIIMLKVQPLGGIDKSIAIAQKYGKPVVVSSALESAVGISRGLRLASLLPDYGYAHGLGTGALLLHDVDSLPIINGEIELRDVDPVFDRYRVSPDRYQWWEDRLMKCVELLS